MNQRRSFVSYSNLDRELVAPLVARLKQEGALVWWDRDQIGPGDSLAKRVQQGIQSSDRFLVCLSKNYITSGWCEVEWEAMLDRKIQDSVVRIIPILIDELSDHDVPLLLKGRRRIDV